MGLISKALGTLGLGTVLYFATQNPEIVKSMLDGSKTHIHRLTAPKVEAQGEGQAPAAIATVAPAPSVTPEVWQAPSPSVTPAANTKPVLVEESGVAQAASAAVRLYFGSLKERNYREAYAMLSTGFVRDYGLTLESYSNWWQNYRPTMGQITSVARFYNGNLAVSTSLSFTGRQPPDIAGKIEVGLKQENGQWKIDHVSQGFR